MLLHPEVTAIAPFAYLNAMLIRGSSVETVTLMGVDPIKEQTISIIGEFIDSKTLDDLAAGKGIILGKSLAERLNVSQSGSL